MKEVKLTVYFDDDLSLEGATIDSNDTGYKINSSFVHVVARLLLAGVEENLDRLELDDMLRDMGISRPKE